MGSRTVDTVLRGENISERKLFCSFVFFWTKASRTEEEEKQDSYNCMTMHEEGKDHREKNRQSTQSIFQTCLKEAIDARTRARPSL